MPTQSSSTGAPSHEPFQYLSSSHILLSSLNVIGYDVQANARLLIDLGEMIKSEVHHDPRI